MVDSANFYKKLFHIAVASALLTLGANASMAQLDHPDGRIAIEVDDAHQYTEVFLNTDNYSGSFELDIAAADRGKQASLFAVGLYRGQWFIKHAEGWQPWDGTFATLQAFATTTLAAQTPFDLFQGEPLPDGEYALYVAYQVEGEEIVPVSEPIRFDVLDASKDSLHRFQSDEAMGEFLKEAMQARSGFSIWVPASEADQVNSLAPAPNLRVSETNIQVSGVDEGDTVKTDGEHLYTLRECGSETCVVTFRLDPANAVAEEIGVYAPEGSPEENNYTSARSLYLAQGSSGNGEDVLVTLSGQNQYIAWFDVWSWGSSRTRVDFLSAADPSKLALRDTLVLDGDLVSSRRIGNTLYLVTRYTPGIEGFQPNAFDDETRLANQQLLSGAGTAELTPTVRFDGEEPLALVAGDDCYLSTGSVDVAANPSIITVSAVPLDNPRSISSTCYVGDTETVFMTPGALYLATTQYEYQFTGEDRLLYDPEHTTAIHKFALTGEGVNYTGSGEVRGHLGWSENKRAFRMGETGESSQYLNIVTSVGDTWNESSSTRLTVLEDSGDRLDYVNHIDGIGKPGEQLYAARFLGDRAYLVTFRVIDPLYVVDLSEPAEPVIAGELEIEGYSDYLHPVSDTLLLGVGKDAVPDDGSSDFGFARGAWYQGVKLSLFDVSNPAAPTEIDALVYGKRGSESEVLQDHHGFTFLPATETSPARIAVPIQVHENDPTFAGWDPSDPSTWYSFTNRGLYTFEADASGLRETGYIEASSSDTSNLLPAWGQFGDRSVLADDAVFYIHQGEVLSAFWGQTAVNSAE